VHTPAWHVSVCVHALPSEQPVPSGFGVLALHCPSAGLQVPATWHWSLAVHVTGLLPVHTPAWHVSVREQALRSLQAVPFGFASWEHAPVAGSQVPAS